MSQVSRNVTDADDGFWVDCQFLSTLLDLTDEPLIEEEI
jgi:hypothetical protein